MNPGTKGFLLGLVLAGIMGHIMMRKLDHGRTEAVLIAAYGDAVLKQTRAA